MDDYRQDHPDIVDTVAISPITIGYESWVFLYQANLAGAISLDGAIEHFLEHSKQYPICQQYVAHPENCLVV